MHASSIIAAFTEDNTERLTGITTSQLRYWDSSQDAAPERRVDWHDSDGLDGTVSGPKTGQMRPGSVVRCHLRPPLHLVGGGRNPLLRFGGGAAVSGGLLTLV